MPGAMQTGMGHDASTYHPEGVNLTAKTFATEFPWSDIKEVAKTIVVLTQDGIGTTNGALVPTDNGWMTV
jgi:hypothetical protein